MECRVFGLLKKAAAPKGRVGITFRSGEMAVAVVLRDGQQPPVLDRCEIVKLDGDSDPAAIAEAIRGLGLANLPTSAVLQPEEYQLVLVEAPDVPPAELRAAMRWRLRDAIDFRVEDAVVDVFDVPQQARGSAGRMVYAVAARKGAVDRHAQRLATLPFDVIDVPELCLRNLASLLPGADAGAALLYLGETAATVVLVRAKTFYFARQMNLRGAPTHLEFNKAIGTDAVADWTGAALELQRSLDYYERNFDQPPISRIAIAPFGPRAEAFAAALGRETGLAAKTFDLNELLRCTSPIDGSQQSACLLAVGAALREEHRTL